MITGEILINLSHYISDEDLDKIELDSIYGCYRSDVDKIEIIINNRQNLIRCSDKIYDEILNFKKQVERNKKIDNLLKSL